MSKLPHLSLTPLLLLAAALSIGYLTFTTLHYVVHNYQVHHDETSVRADIAHRCAHGWLELETYGCATHCRERLILRIRFEQYLLGISEVSNTWPRQALQTQAVASRTYAAYAVERYGSRSDCSCDLTDGGNDQTYVGWSKESSFEGMAKTSNASKIEAFSPSSNRPIWTTRAPWAGDRRRRAASTSTSGAV